MDHLEVQHQVAKSIWLEDMHRKKPCKGTAKYLYVQPQVQEYEIAA